MTQISHIGCDPEVFLQDKNGRFISSVGLIGGTKDAPMPIDDLGNAVQEDNVAVEFNTRPCHTWQELREMIQRNLHYVSSVADAHGLQVAIVPSAVFDDEQLASRAAQVFGCEPDYNAWTCEKNPRPYAPNANLRSCGGHIHVELKDDDDKIEVIKWMDVYVGCQLLKYDTDNQRRMLYGGPGAFRPKPYGVEYRTPSNVWIQSDELIQFVWDQTDKALEAARSGRKIPDEFAQKIQDCIKNSDLELLKEIEQALGS